MAVWLKAKVHEHGLGPWPRLNNRPACDTQHHRGSICGVVNWTLPFLKYIKKINRNGQFSLVGRRSAKVFISYVQAERRNFQSVQELAQGCYGMITEQYSNLKLQLTTI